jgi:hypothetical protein
MGTERTVVLVVVGASCGAVVDVVVDVALGSAAVAASAGADVASRLSAARRAARARTGAVAPNGLEVAGMAFFIGTPPSVPKLPWFGGRGQEQTPSGAKQYARAYAGGCGRETA